MSILQLVMQRKLIKFFTQTKQGLKGRRNNLGHNCFQFKFWAFVCCIHFHTYVLVKGIIPSLLLQIWVKQQVMLHSLALDGSQSKRRKTSWAYTIVLQTTDVSVMQLIARNLLQKLLIPLRVMHFSFSLGLYQFVTVVNLGNFCFYTWNDFNLFN